MILQMKQKTNFEKYKRVSLQISIVCLLPFDKFELLEKTPIYLKVYATPLLIVIK